MVKQMISDSIKILIKKSILEKGEYINEVDNIYVYEFQSRLNRGATIRWCKNLGIRFTGISINGKISCIKFQTKPDALLFKMRWL